MQLCFFPFQPSPSAFLSLSVSETISLEAVFFFVNCVDGFVKCINSSETMDFVGCSNLSVAGVMIKQFR